MKFASDSPQFSYVELTLFKTWHILCWIFVNPNEERFMK
ncbi:hypothetical protein LEP1GSC035_0581 [Leptospira noguchii str. 2007001578]|uniref:Uncharacterized protein n=1 Tax=Leptospira noguchii str. 2007001578 TaxID=1049974 RepID=A0ABP2T9A2_9LEPT|nr:hypothetical protein LEP1GSC035_4699 [Leptospira noguchii str. 2007001578]EMN00821.1 hypothetical protein LEP1GSC035_0581 [Leptospira noguchii str. 2007001578]